MRKQLRLASIVAGMAIIASACSSPSTSSAPSAAPSTSAEPGASGSAAPAALSGEITLWHSYGSGGGETGALNSALGKVHDANPELKIAVVEQPFDQIFFR